MATHHARARRNRGPWLQALLANQAETAGVKLDDLADFIESTKDVKHSLIAVDNPAPARGYALVLPVSQALEGQEMPNAVLARVHVIPSQSAEVYRALFSQIIVQARRMRGELGLSTDVQIVVDSSTAAPHVVEAVEMYGEPYAVRMGEGAGDVPSPEAKPTIEGEPAVDEDDDEVATIIEDSTDEDAPSAEDEDAEKEVEEAEEESDSLYECLDCGRTFKSPQALGSHSRSHQVE